MAHAEGGLPASAEELAEQDKKIAQLEARWEERNAEKERKRQENAARADPTETANVFWREFNEVRGDVMNKIEAAENLAKQEREKENSNKQPAGGLLLLKWEDCGVRTHFRVSGAKVSGAGTLLKDASVLIADLQEKVARATLFLPGYDQRMGNDAVTRLHEAVSEARNRCCPPENFTFKTRKSPAPTLATLIAQTKRDVGTTSGEDHLQGDTKAEDLDPDLCFVDQVGATLIKKPGDVNGKDIVLARLKNCTVYICDTCGAVRADRLENCKIYLGPVRSVLLEKMENSTFSVAAQQLRIHSATKSSFYVRMRSGPIIEHSNSVGFGPYIFNYTGADKHLETLGLAAENGMWCKVEDFNWLRAQQSPNWHIIADSDMPDAVHGPGGDALPAANAHGFDDEM